MLTIYIWSERYIDSEGDIHVGHVAMQAGKAYISFFPKEKKRLSGKGYSLVRSYAGEKGRADHEIMINLPPGEIETRWTEFLQQPKEYNLLRYNCSTVVREFLFIATDSYLRKNPFKVLGRAIRPSNWGTTVRGIAGEAQEEMAVATPLSIMKKALYIQSIVND